MNGAEQPLVNISLEINFLDSMETGYDTPYVSTMMATPPLARKEDKCKI